MTDDIGETSERIALRDLGAEAITASNGWDRALNWRWVDAAAWVAKRDPELMALVRGYRFYIRQRLSPDISEGACRNVLRNYVSESEWRNAEHLLRQALEDGSLSATSIASVLWL